MEYSYEILKSEPQHKYLSVRYYAEGRDSYFRNFNPEDWSSEAAIKSLIEEYAPLVIQHWEYQQSAPTETPVAAGTTYTANTNSPNLLVYPNTAEPPAYDPITQWIEVREEPDENNILQWDINQYGTEELLFNVRRVRDALLRETDYAVLSDTTAASSEMLAYRQALRDIPQQASFPTSITWPTKPA